MQALVTGGGGFIGSHLVDGLLARGDQVHVVDNLSTGSRENLASGAELHELDIRDESFEQLAGELGPELVFHLAAQADVGTSVERPAFETASASGPHGRTTPRSPVLHMPPPSSRERNIWRPGTGFTTVAMSRAGSLPASPASSPGALAPRSPPDSPGPGRPMRRERPLGRSLRHEV